MTILSFQRGGPGQNISPVLVRIKSSNTLAEVTASGYLNPYLNSQGLVIEASDFVFVAASDGNQIYKPVFTGTTIQLEVLP